MKNAREILTENLYRGLIGAAEQAADALMNADPGNPRYGTGWASDESRDAWVALRAAIEKAKGSE